MTKHNQIRPLRAILPDDRHRLTASKALWDDHHLAATVRIVLAGKDSLYISPRLDNPITRWTHIDELIEMYKDYTKDVVFKSNPFLKRIKKDVI